MKKSLVVFGTIEFGKSHVQGRKLSPTYLGGNGVLASLAAAKVLPTKLMGVVGTDINERQIREILPAHIDIKNIEQYAGKTFRYKAVYNPRTFEIASQDISFGVYAQYKPLVLSKEIKESEYILLSGSNPKYGLEIVQQLNGKGIIGVCTLLYHLHHNFSYAKQLIRESTYLFTSRKEYEFLLQKNIDPFVLGKNLRAIFMTEGKKGVRVFVDKKSLFFPVKDPVNPSNPTNAGDVFAGTVMGMLAKGYSVEKDLALLIFSAQEEAMKVITNDSYYRKEINKNRTTSLKKIVQTKKEEVILTKKVLPLQQLQILCQKNRKYIRNFSRALQKRKSVSLIAEIKKASPSRGIIRPDFDHKLLAREYEDSGLVNAISVLTDRTYFQGEVSFIKDIKKLTTIPILRKDFIIDEYQIYESYLAGADAILLIVGILTESRLKKFLAIAGKLGLDCLVEIHTKDELVRAINAKAKIIGINARNLQTFAIDKDIFKRLSSLVPKEMVLVAESGVATSEDIENVAGSGADAVLIGTSFMKAINVREKIQAIMGGGYYGRNTIYKRNI